MTHMTLSAGQAFPKIDVPKLGGGQLSLGQPSSDADWSMVVVYRGQHCPLCTKYLTRLKDHVEDLAKAGVSVMAVSGDSEAQAHSQIEEINPNYAIGYALTTAQMEHLGAYISDPRSEKETDHPFAEPALFLINGQGDIQIADYSNAPFARPELGALVRGISFIRDKDYPIRGTHNA